MDNPSKPTSPTVRDDPRCAGSVLRYHTWPMIKQQTVAEHSWNVARILLAIHPNCNEQLLAEALFHDIGEVSSGDAPFPIKRENPTLKTEMDRIENDSRLAMVLPWSIPAPVQFSEFSRWTLKLADMLEMWECGLQEVMMGNRFASLIVERVGKFLTTQIKSVANDDPHKQEILSNVKHYMNKRKSAWQM